MSLVEPWGLFDAPQSSRAPGFIAIPIPTDTVIAPVPLSNTLRVN